MICKFADLVVELKDLPKEISDRFEEYKTQEQPLTTLEISKQDTDYVINLLDGKCSYVNAVVTAYLRKFVDFAIDYNTFFLHSALIDVDGTGIAFAALSGTGKTTHMRLWQKLLGDRVTVINGDKPMVMVTEAVEFPIGYGTPWNGKERLGCNSKTEIKHICFIERSAENSCERLNKQDAIEWLFKQVSISRYDTQSVSKTLKLIDLFLKRVSVWKIKCNMDIKAAKIAYNAILGEANED